MSYYRYSNSSYHRPSFFGGFQFFPPVIKTLLVSNVVVWLLVDLFLRPFVLHGVAIGGSDGIITQYLALWPVGPNFQMWQLFTYMFMHGGFMHLLFNMFALWMFGMELENVWGSKKFLAYYLVCGLGAGLSNLFIGPFFGPGGPTVGASGAIYGVLIAFGMMFPDRPIFVYFLLPIRARYFVLIYIFLELYAGVTSSPDGIAHFAHLGGAAVGYVYLLIDRKRLPFQNVFLRWRGQSVASGRVTEHPRYESRQVSDAQYYDIHGDEDRINQQSVDEILDKISQNGYQSLTENEKKILFEASKKLN
ncbi:MAG: rhomboid family intramembrane serine protease [Ignavibacteriae bacterium]|nr:rhomboid family intramembrane serine protease [Ignavibacteria bacterium]MBI3363661.1 rhomboid family intramembrane serine protease [Ignavibacteriota bacterium]